MEDHHKNHPDKPFFMMIGTPAAHANFIPPPQYWETFTNVTAPRTPNYNKVCDHCHKPVRNYSPMGEQRM